MLFAVEPFPFVALAIVPHIRAKAMLHIVDELALIGAAIRKLQKTLPVHLIVKPLALVDTAISPLIAADTLYFVVDPLAVVH